MWPCVHQIFSFVQLGREKQGVWGVVGGLWKMYKILLYFKCIAALLCVLRCAVFFKQYKCYNAGENESSIEDLPQW